MGTVIVLIIIAGVIAGAVFSIIRSRKKGKSSCGCGCSSCSIKEKCKGK